MRKCINESKVLVTYPKRATIKAVITNHFTGRKPAVSASEFKRYLGALRQKK